MDSEQDSEVIKIEESPPSKVKKKPKAVVPRVHPHLRRDMFYLLRKVAVSNPLMIQNRNINQVRF